MKLHWLSPTSEHWLSHLSKVEHDVYHRPEYVAAEAEMAGGQPLAILVKDKHCSLFLPLIMRKIENNDLWDVTSPKGYPGPLVSAVEENAYGLARFAADAMSLALQRMRERDVISCFVRCHPFLTRGAAGLKIRGTTVEHGNTVYIDLGQSEEQLWRQTRSSHRSEINRCKKSGFETIIDEDWKLLDEFIEMYYETMRRVSATKEHFWGREYFATLRDQLSEHVFLSMTLCNGIPASGGIFTKCGELVQYHLGATGSQFVRQHPSKLLLDCTRRWAKGNGYRIMHLGGGVTCLADSLLNFKLGFSKLRTTFQTYRYIVDEARYREVAQAWTCEQREPHDGVEGFFPAYRKEAAAVVTARKTAVGSATEMAV